LKKVLKVLFSRIATMALLLTIQIAVLIWLILKLRSSFLFLYSLFGILSLIVVFFITSQRSNPSHKLAWVIPIMVFPVFGALLYIILRTNGTSRRFRKSINSIYEKMLPLMQQEKRIMEEIESEDRCAADQARYILNSSGFPIYKNTETEYFPSGEEFFVSLIEELNKAEKFIFIEIFIIREGLMWNTVLSILEKKAGQGLDIRVMYDDAGCMGTLPKKYNEKLRAKGIKCYAFNPFTPMLDIRMNHRDHRKIIVIDGHTAFTGGINLADEYINAYERCGYWKDAAIFVRGEAVWSMTLMFLHLWEYISGTREEYLKFKPSDPDHEDLVSDGYVQPFGDNPLDNEPVGEYTYINMIGRAKKYVYIYTPYLVLDNEMTTILILAAKSGVDVRIVTPHIPDKWYVFMVTQSYYDILIEAGVKIYEYNPGFLHSKAFVCDDVMGIVGSINLDYRSLYFHFECGVWLYKTKSVKQIKDDFDATFEHCRQITLDECKNVKLLKRIIRGFFRLFAPLM
jgi:cardiolipin synthase